MAKSEAVYFGAIWTEDKDTPTGSMDVEKLAELVSAAESAGEDKIYFSAFDNERKENENQPDVNLVHYPSEGGGRKKSRKKGGWGGKKRGSSKKSAGKKRSYGGSKKSSMF